MALAEVRKLFRSTRVLLPGGIQEAGLLVLGGKITMIIKGPAALKQLSKRDLEVEDFGNLLVMPGLIDSHVHVNEPGRTEWEGFQTATKAAAAGGVTTIADMPLNSIPPTTTVANLATKVAATESKLHVDCAFWGGLIPSNVESLRPLIKEGVVGFKCFLCPSGVEEFPHVTRDHVEKALRELKETNTVLAFHAECEPPVKKDSGKRAAGGKKPEEEKQPELGNPEKYSTFLESRQPQMEEDAVRMVAELCDKFGARCHIVHLSAAEALPIIREAKIADANLTVETCYHYLTLTAEQVPDQAVEFKCCPPIRSAENQEELWEAIKEGDIDMVVSDHSPCTIEMKKPSAPANFMQAWGGIASLQFGLPLLWTAARKRGFKIPELSRLVSENTAALIGLEKRKGRLSVGFDADLVVWDPDEEFEVVTSMIQHKNKLTPYLGRTLQGVVNVTVVRGNVVYRLGDPFPLPMGTPLLLKT